MTSSRLFAQIVLVLVCLMAISSVTLLGALAGTHQTAPATFVGQQPIGPQLNAPTFNVVEDDEGHTVHVVALR